MSLDLRELEDALTGPGSRILAWDHNHEANGTVHVCEVGETGARTVFSQKDMGDVSALVDALAVRHRLPIGALYGGYSYVWRGDDVYVLWNATGVVARSHEGTFVVGTRPVPVTAISYVHSFWDFETAGDSGVHLVLTDGKRVPLDYYKPSSAPDPFVVSWYESEMDAAYTHGLARDLATWLGVEHREQDRLFNRLELDVRPFLRELADTGAPQRATVEDAVLMLALEPGSFRVDMSFAGGLVRGSRVLRQGEPEMLRAYLRGLRVGRELVIARNQLRTQLQPCITVPVLTFAVALSKATEVVAAWDSTDDRDTADLTLYEVSRKGAQALATLTVNRDLWHEVHTTLAERAIAIGTADTRRLCVWVAEGDDFTVWTDRKRLDGATLHGDRGWPLALARDLERRNDTPMRELRALADRVQTLPGSGAFEDIRVPSGTHELRVGAVPETSDQRFLELRVHEETAWHARWLRIGTNADLVRYLRSLRTLRDIARAASDLRAW